MSDADYNIAAILSTQYPGREWKLDGNDPSTLVFLDDGPVISTAELGASWAATQQVLQDKLVQDTKNKLILQKYTYQDQILILLKAILGDTSDAKDMDAFVKGL